MADPFSTRFSSLGRPAMASVAVVPHDSNALIDIPQALYIGTAGNLTVRLMNDTADRVFKNVPGGTFMPLRAQYVRATGTAAADIVALY